MGSRGRERSGVHAGDAGGNRVKASARLRPRGFWRGMLTGVAVAAAAGIALTLVFPPVRFFAPAVDPLTQLPPVPPAAPAGAKGFARPRGTGAAGAAGRAASLVPAGDEPAPEAAGLLRVTGPGAEAQRAPLAPAAPGGGGAVPEAPAAAPGLLGPAAGAPLVKVAGEAPPDLGALLPPAAPNVGLGTPSLVPPGE